MHPALHPYAEHIMMQSTAECRINTKGVYPNVRAKRKNGDTGKPLKDDHTIFESVKSLYKRMARTRGNHGLLLAFHEEVEEEELGIHKEEEIGIQYEEVELGIHEEEEELRIQFVIMRLHLPLLSSG
jgi:hypothetical protein